jgi:hypothetical protein
MRLAMTATTLITMDVMLRVSLRSVEMASYKLTLERPAMKVDKARLPTATPIVQPLSVETAKSTQPQVRPAMIVVRAPTVTQTVRLRYVAME